MKTFHDHGIRCPLCYNVTKNIKNVNEVVQEEIRLVKDAFKRFDIPISEDYSDIQDIFVSDIISVFHQLQKCLSSFRSQDAWLQLTLCDFTLKSLTYVGKTHDELKKEVGLYRLGLSLARIER